MRERIQICICVMQREMRVADHWGSVGGEVEEGDAEKDCNHGENFGLSSYNPSTTL